MNGLVAVMASSRRALTIRTLRLGAHANLPMPGVLILPTPARRQI
jgi:hypothetical protein